MYLIWIPAENQKKAAVVCCCLFLPIIVFVYDFVWYLFISDVDYSLLHNAIARIWLWVYFFLVIATIFLSPLILVLMDLMESKKNEKDIAN